MIYTLTLNPAIDRELTVAALEFDDVLRATGVRTDFGGKGINVSRMLASLGVSSVALGFAGGPAGRMLGDGLAALGIASAFTPIHGETRTNVSIVASDHSRHIKVNEGGPAISATEQEALLAQVRDLAQPDDWWVLAGSLPPGVDCTIYATLIATIQSAGGYVLLDTSGPALVAGCAARPTVIKPNASEMAQLTGLPVTTPQEALMAAASLTDIPVVVISMGSQGAVLVAEGQGILARPPAIQEQNPVGAGDSLVAGLVYGLSRGSAAEALRLGVACGAATASQPGTSVGTRAVVEQLAAQVMIEPLASQLSSVS